MAARTNKTAGDIRCTFLRYRLRLPQVAQVENCRRLCAGWQNRFGACLVLDGERLRVLCRRLIDDRFSVDDCVWAVEAYHQHCRSDRWHLDRPAARKTLVQFFADDRFEEWVARGRNLAGLKQRQSAIDQSAAERARQDRQQLAEQQRRIAAVHEWFLAHAPADQARLLAEARSRMPRWLADHCRHANYRNAFIAVELGKMMAAASGQAPSSQLSAISQKGGQSEWPS